MGKAKASAPTSETDAYVYLLGEHRSDPKGVQSGHVHGQTAICIPKLLSGEPVPVSTQKTEV
jgi:hypothetical protein